jgi:YVTN family beta-propeller protein
MAPRALKVFTGSPKPSTHQQYASPTGRHLFVTNGLSNSISQISTITNRVIRTIKLPNGLKHPLGLTFIQ